MSAPITVSLSVRDITVERAGRTVLSSVDLTVTERSRIAVVGPNGIGKSTLLEVLAGTLAPQRGQVRCAPPTASVGLVRQELDRTVAPTVRELLAADTGVAAAQARFDAATHALADALPGADETYASALEHYLQSGAADFDTRLALVADDLAIPEVLLQRDPRVLSGGEAARVALAVVLLSQFAITMLDEPTNDLDAAGLDRLERWVVGHPGGLVIVSHDRAFLERTVTSVLEIDEHSRGAQWFQGGWEAFLRERATARAHAERRHREYSTERDRLKARAQTQTEWASKGISRAKKSPADNDKFIKAHNVAQSEKLAGKRRITQKALDRLEVVDKPWEGWDLRFEIDEAPRSANIVAALDAAVLERGDFSLGPVDLEVHWAERIALLGPNGSGKSTIIEALLGRLAPTTGNAILGAGVVVGELDQRRGMFERADQSLARVFEDLAGLPVDETRSVLAKFGLDAASVARPSSQLSPGERTRAQLALFQARGVNLLVLDEPTNHLDMAAIEQLEQALQTYTGTLLLVSHDRRLLENVSISRTISLGERPGT